VENKDVKDFLDSLINVVESIDELHRKMIVALRTYFYAQRDEEALKEAFKCAKKLAKPLKGKRFGVGITACVILIDALIDDAIKRGLLPKSVLGRDEDEQKTSLQKSE